VKRWIKYLLSESARRRVRRFGRLRWITKAKVVRRNGESPIRWLRFVLADPEVDSFTYPIGNRDALAQTLAGVLDRPLEEIAGYLAETASDPVLRRALHQPFRHWTWMKRQPEPRGYHLACWTVLRATRPACAVETGILDGMSSTVMLAALEKNADDGHPGELVSFDIMPGAGAMVPDSLRARWHPVFEDAVEALDGVIAARKIGFLASDSLRDAGQIRAEIDAVLRHRAEHLVAMTTSGSLGDLGWPCDEVTRFKEQPVGHFSRGVTFAIAAL
jgi:hypothetical protein